MKKRLTYMGFIVLSGIVLVTVLSARAWAQLAPSTNETPGKPTIQKPEVERPNLRKETGFVRNLEQEKSPQEERVKKEKTSRVTLIAVGVAATAISAALIVRALKKQHKPAGIGLPDDFPNPPGN